MPSQSLSAARPLRRRARPLWAASGLLALALLGGCASGVGIGIGIAPGLSLNLGLSRSGPSIGLGTGWGPLGAGVSLNSAGQVVGSAGAGAGVGVSGVGVGVGVGQSAVLYDPRANPGPPSVANPAVEPGVVVQRPGPMWRPPAEAEAP